MAKKGTVLVVDDEEVMRDVLETVLSQDGYRVDLAKTGDFRSLKATNNIAQG